MSLAVKFGFKNALEMPFSMFNNIIKQIIIIKDEEIKNLACWVRFARFGDDRKFKELIEKKVVRDEVSDRQREKELFARLNKW